MTYGARGADASHREFAEFLESRSFPCLGAKSALNRGQVTYFDGGSITSSGDDLRLLEAFQRFVLSYQRSRKLFTTFVVLFEGPLNLSEKEFEEALWQRLAALHALDRWIETSCSRCICYRTETRSIRTPRGVPILKLQLWGRTQLRR